jgi:hypothetical protein
VAERAGAAVDVDLLARRFAHLELAHQRDRRAGERLVDLDHSMSRMRRPERSKRLWVAGIAE